MLSTILKNKAAIEDKANERPNTDDKCIWKPAYNEVEKVLYQWFLDIRVRNRPVSGLLFQSKARDFAFVLKIGGFNEGSEWLQKFKDRYSIVEKVVAG